MTMLTVTGVNINKQSKDISYYGRSMQNYNKHSVTQVQPRRVHDLLIISIKNIIYNFQQCDI